MQQDNYDSEISCLVKELQASLILNDFLQKENQELQQEVKRLRAQLNSSERLDFEGFQVEKSIVTLPPEPPKVGLNESYRPTIAPPPPPLPSKLLVGSKLVRRVPEVVELYRRLTRKDSKTENKCNNAPTIAPDITRNMIGEIEKRSSLLSAIKSDVRRREYFINVLIKKLESTAYKDISEVEAFVKWLDSQLSSLVDERAVLKHFPQWPEPKADALREAACSYRDLKNLELEVLSFQENMSEPLTQGLRKIQALQDRLEENVSNTEKMRDKSIKRYKAFNIPWEWLLETGLVGQIKLSSLKLAQEYMKRTINELESNKLLKEGNLMLQAVRFAYRIHQAALMEKLYAFSKSLNEQGIYNKPKSS